jgi:hypothetical protein
METIYQKQQRLLIAKGIKPEDAQRIAYFKQRELWRLDNWTYKVNEQWAEYSALSSLQRQLVRRARKENKPINHYEIKDWKVKVRFKFKRR